MQMYKPLLANREVTALFKKKKIKGCILAFGSALYSK